MKEKLIVANGWVYEKVCLDEFQITTELDSKLSYTPCYMNVKLNGYETIRK